MKILAVGTDLTEASRSAEQHGVALARAHGCKVVFVHALPTLDMFPADIVAPPYADAATVERQAVSDRMEALIAEYPDIEADIRIVDGHPDERIVAVAEESEADLVIVGSHGRTGLSRFVMGSVAERVVRLTSNKAMVARSAAPQAGYRRILVPTDFSQAAERAFVTALELVGDDGTVELLNCWQSSHFVAAHENELAAPNLAQGRESDALERARRLMHEHPSDRAAVSFRYLEGTVTTAIVERVEQRKCDLVVMGSHGHRGVRRWLLGSTAETTVRHAPCSVLVVHPDGSYRATAGL